MKPVPRALAFVAVLGASPGAWAQSPPPDSAQDKAVFVAPGESRPRPAAGPDNFETSPAAAPANVSGPQFPKPSSTDGAGAAVSGAASADAVWDHPKERPADLTPRWVDVTPADRTRASADAGSLKGIRILSLRGGVAEVLLAGEPAPRPVRAGARIGADTVVRVEAERIVLSRPPGPGETGEATVIVKAGPVGTGWVRVYTRKPITTPATPGAARTR